MPEGHGGESTGFISFGADISEQHTTEPELDLCTLPQPPPDIHACFDAQGTGGGDDFLIVSLIVSILLGEGVSKPVIAVAECRSRDQGLIFWPLRSGSRRHIHPGSGIV